MSVVIISHVSCWDGTAAAWVAERYCQEHQLEFKTYYAQYNEPSPIEMDDIKGKDVYILDFSFSADYLNELASVANKVVVLDHHKSAKANLENATACECHFDLNRSGARLAWDYFYPNETVPEIIDRIEDRDLWIWSFPNNENFMTGMLLFPKTVNTIEERFVNNDYFDIALTGQSYREILNKQAEAIVNAGFYTEVKGHRVLMAQYVPLWYSEVGNIAAERSDTQKACIYRIMSDRTVILNFRSINNVDVSEIAEALGGGGHRMAAGAKVTIDYFQSLLP